MVFAVRDLMKDAYPELNGTAERVSKAVLAEETRFAHTMEVGLKKLEEDLQPLTGKGADTFPVYSGTKHSNSTTHLACRSISCRMRRAIRASSSIKLDSMRAMAEQRERARASWKGAAKQTANPEYQKLPAVGLRRLPSHALRRGRGACASEEWTRRGRTQGWRARRGHP